MTKALSLAYVDDILIYSRSESEHLDLLERILQRLTENTLYIKQSKCSVGMDRSEFCGTIVSAQGIHLASDKLPDLFETSYPRNVKQVQSFLGVCNWFRDFIPAFSLVSTPLTNLTQKDSRWEWNESHQNAVILLLHRISSAPCLR
jgi:hypothetical protein